MRGVALATLAVLAVACEDGGGGKLPVMTDSESHWLMACTDAGDCAGLACLCGVCTRACDDAAACASVGPGAVCAADDACGAAVCTATCQRDADCGAAHLVCDEGACLAAVSVGPDLGQLDLGAPPPDAALPGPDAVPTDAADAAVAVDGGPTVDAAPSVDAAPTDAGVEADAGACPPGPDTCVQDVECADGDVCVTPAAHGVRNSMCVRAACSADADCVEHPEGRCTPFLAPCRELGFFCTYAVDPCRVDEDCPQRGAPKVCEPIEGSGGTQCVDAP